MSTRTSTTNITTSSPEPAHKPIMARTNNEPSRPAEAPQSAQIAATAPSAETEASAREFVFRHESSGRLDAENSIGCSGLGQDCTGQLVKACPDWRVDRPCQLAYWQRYAERRYGTWVAAKAHWLARVPINGKDCGFWW